MRDLGLIDENGKNSKEESSKSVPSSRLATILQVLPSLGSDGGVERGTVEIAQAIREKGGRAIVAASMGPKSHELKRIDAEYFNLPLDSKNPIVILKNIGRLAKLIRTEGVDIIHARSRAPAWSSYFAAKKTGCPLVTTFHGTYNMKGHIKRKYNSVMTFGNPVIAISGFIARHLKQNYGLPNKRIRIIQRGVDINKFNPESVSAERIINLAAKWRLPEGSPVIMLPGRLTRWKGQAKCIEAIAKMKRRDLICLLVGGDQGRSSYRKELEKLAISLNLEKIVRIVGHCDDMPAAYMLADLVISASLEPEAFGRVIVEAQALGRPVIASDHGGPQETILPGKTGWLFPSGNISALAIAIEKGLSLDEKKRSEFFDNGIEHVRRNFSKELMCTKTLEVYNEVLEKQFNI